MVAGHLQEKNGNYYMVVNYHDAAGKRKTKWFPTGLPVKGNKKKAEKMLMELRKEYVPDEKPLEQGILFSDGHPVFGFYAAMVGDRKAHDSRYHLFVIFRYG